MCSESTKDKATDKVIPLKEGSRSEAPKFVTKASNASSKEPEKGQKKPVWGLQVPKNHQQNTQNSHDLPILLKNRLVGNGNDHGKDDERLLKEELKLRPVEPNMESYKKVPVEEFGAAMLRGMGWKGLKNNSDKDSSDQVIKYVPRPERLGLGASQVADESELRTRKPIEASLGIELNRDEEKRIQQLERKKTKNKTLDLHHANYIGIDEKLSSTAKRFKSSIVEPGSHVFIVDGPHSNLSARIINENRLDPAAWLVRLDVNEEILSIPKSHVKLYNLEATQKVSKDKLQEPLTTASSFIWTCPGLKVKIKSKSSFMNGRYYNRKGSILDVQSDASCTIILDSSNETIYKVPQSALQTCLPRTANPATSTVKYLKNDRGSEFFHAPFRVLQFNDQNGTAVIQAEDELEVVFEANYNDICEFTRE